MDQQQLSAKLFGSGASNYLTSTVHAQGADLERLRTLASEQPQASVLDLGCGAGHASFALLQGGAHLVTAYDPSRDMLSVVQTEAARRGFDRLETCLGAAESLPFADASFDCIVSRFSAHHWADVPAALRECARVLKSQGKLVIIDVVSPELPLLDTALQVIEFLRDASHVRDYRISEWRAMQTAAGFAMSSIDSWKLFLEFQSWTARIKTPPERIAALSTVFSQWSKEAKEYFGLKGAGSFSSDTAWLQSSRLD